MQSSIRDMVIIGSGNVAWHLLNAFTAAGIQARQVLSRNAGTARQLSKSFNVPVLHDPDRLVRDAGIYILAVQDDRIRETAKGLHLHDQLLVHTSGFTGMDALAGASGNTGVMWPLQTLTTGKTVDYRSIPFFIEASSSAVGEELNEFAALVSDRIIVADSQTRQKVHLAAVIASNLTNHLYAIAAAILTRQDIPYDVLASLIVETARKAAQSNPVSSQTGPAARKDLKVMEKHLDLLKEEPAYRDIYKLISENIIHHHNE
jgi:predicted short-subunit dehydrogenase-like oxidoreductase (DUF2520 family)